MSSTKARVVPRVGSDGGSRPLRWVSYRKPGIALQCILRLHGSLPRAGAEPCGGLLLAGADSLSLPPGQAFRLPASRRSTMARGIDAALESVGDVIGVRETLRL